MALAALKDRKMLPNGSLVPWQSPDNTPISLAAAAPGIPWTDLAYALVPNGSTLEYVSDAPYYGGNGRIGVEKEAWVSTLYLQGLTAPTGGFYAPTGTPGADPTGWRQLLESGGPYDGDPQAQAIVAELMQHHSSYYIDASEPPAPLMITSGWTDDLFPANESIRFYNRTGTQYPSSPIALNLMDFGHPRGQNKPATVAAITAAENSWFDYYVKGDGSPPPSQVQAMTQTCPSAADPGGPYFADTYGELSRGEVRFTSPKAEEIATEGTLYGPEFGHTTPGQKRVQVSKLELRLPVREQAGSLHGLVKQAAEKVLPKGYHLASEFAQGPPDTFITRALGMRTHARHASFKFDSSDVGSTFECRLDGEAFAACDYPQAYDHLAPGRHVFRVRATDADALTDLSPASRKFRILR